MAEPMDMAERNQELAATNLRCRIREQPNDAVPHRHCPICFPCARLILMAAGLLLLCGWTVPLCAAEIWPDPDWSTVEPSVAGLDSALLRAARDYALTGGGSGLITRGGQVAMSWGDQKKRYDLKSTTKSFGATALGIALIDGKVRLTDFAVQHHPSLAVPPEANLATGWTGQITLLHLATHTAGFPKHGGYEQLICAPGTQWHYSDGGPNWLAECITLIYQQDVDQLMFERVFTPIGIRRDDLVWRSNSYRPRTINGIPRREFGSGISANVEAMARLGLLYLREGRWKGRQILPADFVRQASTTVPSVVGLPEADSAEHGNASQHYGLLWWNNADGSLSEIPRDASWSWGLYDSLIVVIPSLDMVIARAGQSWPRKSDGHYDVLHPFLVPIVAAAHSPQSSPQTSDCQTSAGTSLAATAIGIAASSGLPQESPDEENLLEVRRPDAAGRPHPRRQPSLAPYPYSTRIIQIEWAPAETIIRRARGSDNWPLTWADDDHLYTAYGDGKGFEPLIDRKLSMGLARLTGPPSEFVAENLRAPTFETRGDGAQGPKASGLLMVDHVLYALVRNVDNSQVGRSADHGATWTWSDWKLTESFGCPTFLNFGSNYQQARDGYAYVYSHDNDSAYLPADQMVLARMPANKIMVRKAWEFFAGTDAEGHPTWSPDIHRRAPVFTHPSRCYRSGITFNAGLQRYLWCQILPGEDPRFHGGFGIYDAPEPWGPWTTAFFTERWDVGPGESSSLPTKWMSDDGQTVHLVFSGEDHFSVRRAFLHPPTTPDAGRQ